MPPVAAEKEVIPGTLAYWRFEGQNGVPVSQGSVAVPDLSGHGNDLTRVNLSNGVATDMVYTQEFHPAQPSRGSLFINGSSSQTALRPTSALPITRR